MRFYEEVNKSRLSLQFFFSKNDSELNSKFFSLQKWFGTEFRGFFSSEKWFERNSEGFFLKRNGSERNSEGFSLLRNGLERNFKVFFFREKKGEILMELPSVPSCSIFHRILFLSENGNPNWG
jgi:hypothetical protein